jgi:acyl-homoserine lactone acylase PvdQ
MRVKVKHVSWAVLALTWVALSAAAATSTTVQERDWSVAGLDAPADIVIDHWGIAHIFAASIHDAFFLQGYNAARDRLWQIDLWRKPGLGLLAKSLGPAYVDQDRAARLFLYRGDMEKEWAAYAPESRQWVTAFVDGLNAFVAQVQSGARPLPVEFKLTDSRPDTWRAEDVLRMLMDVGAWDNSVAINTQGQSDDPMSAHYRDLFPMWAQGSYVPLRFSRAAVDGDAEDVIHLTPGR